MHKFSFCVLMYSFDLKCVIVMSSFLNFFSVTDPEITTMFVSKLIFFSAVINVAFSCYQCFIDVEDSLRLCWGHILTEYNTRNVDSCFKTLDRIFNNETRVIEAGKVGKNEPINVYCNDLYLIL